MATNGVYQRRMAAACAAPPEQIQATKDMTVDRGLRAGVVVVLLVVFVGLDWFVLRLVQQAMATDARYVVAKLIAPEQRLVSERVLMFLIGATAYQTAAAMNAIISYLFPRGSRGPNR